jgi:hypothetical protein
MYTNVRWKGAKSLALILIVILLAPQLGLPLISPPLLAKAQSSEELDRSKLIMLAAITLALSDIPLDQVEKYELFHTLHIHKNGSIELINEPYLSSDLVLNITELAASIKENTNISVVSSEGRIDVYMNETLALSIEYGVNLTSWTFLLGELYNKSLDDNTVVYWRNTRVNFTNEMVNYNLIYLVRNVSDTHRVYVATVGELKDDGSGYSNVFTFACYWFKEKRTLFGDWIVLPEGAENLSNYYELLAYGVRWLSANVYNGTSPGYVAGGEGSGYVPQAYPQIANALEALGKNLPAELDLPVEKGYALVTDINPLLIGVIVGAVLGGISYTIQWARTTGCDVSRWDWGEFTKSVVSLGLLGSRIAGFLVKIPAGSERFMVTHMLSSPPQPVSA